MFKDKARALRNECITILTEKLNKQGNPIEIFDISLLDDIDNVEVYDLPRFITYGKYNTFIEYAITNVQMGENGIEVGGQSIYDEMGGELNVSIEYLDLSALCYLVDEVEKLDN